MTVHTPFFSFALLLTFLVFSAFAVESYAQESVSDQAEQRVTAGQSGLFDLSAAGLRVTFTHPSDTDGMLKAHRFHSEPANNLALNADDVTAPNGEVIRPARVSPDRYWHVSAEGLTGFTHQICLGIDALPGVINPESLVLVHRAASADNWQPMNSTLELVDGTPYLCADGLTSFSEFGVASGADNVLPVELVSFEARIDGEAIVLQWQTASETNNAGFEVQQRVGERFEQVAFVEGHGTTAEARAYQHRVEALEAGRYVFRLRQVDFDGAFAYSPEVEVVVEVPEGYQLSSVYPNPFNPRAQFTLALSKAQQVEVAVYDVLGRRVALLHRGMLSANEAHQFELDGSGLSSGLYLIRVEGEMFAEVRQAMLLK